MKLSYKIVVKKFSKRDVFYNNGLVNLIIHLDKSDISYLEYELNSTELTLKIPATKEEECYDKLFQGFIEDNEIIIRTDNDRLYWDKDNGCFCYDKKYDVIGKSSGNDVKNLYNYINAKDIGVTTEELYKKYLQFSEANNLKQKLIKEDSKNFIKRDKFKKDNECKIPLLMTRSEAVKSYKNYLVKGNKLKYDSKIHQFEDGGFCFKDMVNNKDSFINKWDALIYWNGVRIKRYYNSAYYIYFNSTDLLALYQMKKNMRISDESIKIKDDKNESVKSIPTNLDFYEQLIWDGIENSNFYISNTAKEFQVKFMMYMASYMYHIERLYEDEEREKVKRRKEKLYKNLEKISFVTYTEDDSNMKSSLDEYTKMYRMILFMNKLMTIKHEDSTLFKYFAQLITAVTLSKDEKEKVNLNINKFVDNVLRFAELRKVYYNVSFKILKKDKGALGTGLFQFENVYLEEIGRGDIVMNLHSKSKEIGNGIGVFAANLEEKDLLFKLRNIKNHNQMITYFKDLKFSTLKNQEEAKFSKEFNEIVEEILEDMEVKPDIWELIRDYIAIYAIDKYRSVMYAKKNKGGK